MELKDLEIFQVVAKKGTITAAAKELRYVQSNITSRIQKLEEELNTPLFNRHHRGMTLTPEGKKLLTYSEDITLLAKEMKKAVQSKEEPAGRLEIGTIETVFQLPNILASFVKKYKNVNLSLYSGVTDHLEKQVLDHQLDGAFVTAGNFSPEIVAHEVIEEELVLIAHHQADLTDAIQEEPVLCFSKGCGYRARLESWYEDENIHPKKIMEFGTLETILRSVVVGLGIAFVPRSSVSHLEESGLISSYSLPDAYNKVKTMFIRREDTFLTNTLQKFIETIETNKDMEIHSLKY
ncbi:MULTISPECIES: LysR family transcriptional regulator [unclassified Oceanobacillus]|uniref:LysR family transcriptional regulator n=1 Tax=unclassified Oceanobacillus TaxID=2630292 RepID=UPI00300E156B